MRESKRTTGPREWLLDHRKMVLVSGLAAVVLLVGLVIVVRPNDRASTVATSEPSVTTGGNQPKAPTSVGSTDPVLAPTTPPPDPKDFQLGMTSGNNRQASAKPPLQEPEHPRAAAHAFVRAWQGADYDTMQSLTATNDNIAAIYGGTAKRLRISAVRADITTAETQAASFAYDATLTLTGFSSPLKYSSAIGVVTNAQGKYRVAFSPTTLYPGLQSGQFLDLLPLPGKTPILVDRGGSSLSTSQDLTTNVVGKPATSTSSASGLYRVVADNDASVANRTFSAGARVAIVTGAGSLIKEVAALSPTGAPAAGSSVVKTTLDVKIQAAGVRALKTVKVPAAIVAIDTATGEIRALVNKPTTGAPPAFSRGFAPGSTFKVITAAALLSQGLTPASTTTCPSSISIGAYTIRNFKGESFKGPMTLKEAFAHSCNTAFIDMQKKLGTGDLRRAAEAYGFNAGGQLPIASFGGAIPEPDSLQQQAADSIGQGLVQASPLQMASVAASVATGTYRQPHLFPSCPQCRSNPVPGAAELRTMMRAVVTSGTASSAFKGYPGVVAGKTGTAEFGLVSPFPTHGWFIGYQGNLAFAVYIDSGATGGGAAAQAARSFLSQLT